MQGGQYSAIAFFCSQAGRPAFHFAQGFQSVFLREQAFLQVRLAAVSGAVALTARGTGYLSANVAAFVHLLSFAANFGMIFWVSFSSSLL